ncbi:MAG: phytoene desaturase family protein [Solirubrobacteraceae bacterium]
MSERYDVIVVGGGSNGLTAAAFLSRAGKRVLVLEAAPLVGGFSTTEELIPEAPGFRFNKHAIDLFSCMIPTSIVDDLELRRYGFQTVVTDPYATYLGPDGESIAQWRDIDRTCAEIARFSRRDAERYRRFAQLLGDAWNAFLPYLQGHPKRIAPATIVETLTRGAKARKSLGPALRILMSSPAQVLEEWFERDELKVILGTWAAATGQVSLDTPGSAAGMAMAVLSHRWGCYRAIGGMGAVSEALERLILAHGGTIRTSTPVASITLAGSERATGVELVSGELIQAGEVIAAVDPATLFGKLLDPGVLDSDVRDELRAMSICEANITYFTGHAALSARPTLPRHGREQDLLRAGYQMLVPSYQSLKDSLAAAERGEVPTELPIWLSYPSICDRTLVPDGDSNAETLYFMTPVTPYDLAGGRDWADEKQPFFDHALEIIDSYTAGVKDSIIGTASVTPIDMSKWTTKGHACHIDMSLSQMGPWRPTPSLSGYQTPVDGLWQVSAGSHPLPSVNGWAGRTAARTLLARDRRAWRRSEGYARSAAGAESSAAWIASASSSAEAAVSSTATR